MGAVRHGRWLTACRAIILLAMPLLFARITGVQTSDDKVGDWLLLNCLLMVPAGYVALVVQQLVRATAAHLLGFRSIVQIGSGRPLGSFKLGSARVTLSWFPSTAGALTATTDPSSLRLRAWLVCLSGTVAMLVVGCVVLASGGWSFNAVAADVIVSAAIVSLVLLAAAFVILATNDVYYLFSLPAAHLHAMLTWGHLLDALECAERSDHIGAAEGARRALELAPDDPTALGLNVAARQQLGDPALGLARALIEKPFSNPSLQYQALNCWAWGCYLSKDPELLAAADEASSKAVFLTANSPELLPSRAGALDTRGHVLLWAGRYDEAADCLTNASSLATNDGTRCASACGLVMVNAACGRLADAETWLARAKEQAPTYHLIADAEAALHAARA